jgi:hypothetical protein
MPTLFNETKFSVFSGRKDLPTLLDRLDRVFLDGKQQVQVCVTASKLPILQVLRGMAGLASERITLKEIEPEENSASIVAFSLKRRYGLKERKAVSGDFLVLPGVQGNMNLLLWIEPLVFWHEGVSRLLDSAYPRLVRPFFTQTEMHQLVRNIQVAIPTHRVRVLRTSSRERLKAGDARKKYASQVKWTDSDPDTVFRDATATNTWFRTIFFELVFLKDGQFLSDKTFGSISKYGYLSCTSRFSLFYHAVIEPMMEYGESRLTFLQGRTRNATTNFIPKPVKIQYDSDVFSNVSQIGKLLDALKRFKHGSCSVLHGNPYLHVSMLDNYDYSATGVGVLTKNEVLIVPQIRTSEAALKRIISHIFENFREGKLGEASA